MFQKCTFLLGALLLLFIEMNLIAQEQTVYYPAEIKLQEDHVTTIPLKQMELIPSRGKTNWKNGVVPNKGLPERHQKMLNQKRIQPDPIVQKIYNQAPPDNKAVVQNFDGISNTYGVAPPDTQGDVGLNHYIQMVNNGFQIFDKSGNAVTSPTSLSTLWNNLPGPWNGTNNGDPIVLFDETEGRWLLSQFSLPNYPYGPFYELIAISATSDPLGAYHVYAYSFTDMPDYPKFGIWPDGYYMSINRFVYNSSISNLVFNGCGVVAFEKAQMLMGMPAQMIYFTFSSSSDPWSFLPADLDGPPPAPGTPNYFTYVDYWSGTDRLRNYQFSANWITPAFSTFIGPWDVNVASINNNFTTDIVQPGTSQRLDPIEDRLMYRLQYRNFGTYQVMLTNQTVNVGSNMAGVRWYELRNYGSGWNLYQQGTYAPSDSHSRWMASIAMNRNGDIALGYSISSGSLSPSIRYTGRLSTDPSGTMGQPEGNIITGSGYQSGTLRWGDYSCMSVDPADDYTFWYTQEYVNPGGSGAWKTRVASMQFGAMPVADVWTGNSSMNWNDPLNWSDGSAPYRSDDVIIPGSPSPTFWPQITGDCITGLIANNITLNGNANLFVSGNVEITEGTALTCTASDQIYVGGDWINKGQFSPGTGKVIMQGSNSSFIKSEPTTVFERPTIFESTTLSASNYFDILTNGGQDITISSFDINCNVTSMVNVEIWYRFDSYIGNTGSIAGWMQLGGTKTVMGMGVDKATHVVPDIPLFIPAGSTYGMFISCYSGSTGNIRYTSVTQSFYDPNLTINCGDGSSGFQPGMGTIFSTSSWNGNIYYSTGAIPLTPFYDLDITKSDAEVMTACDVNVGNDLSVQPQAFFTNGIGNHLAIGGSFNLESSSTRTGSFINYGSLAVTGSTNVKKEYVDGQWHFISSPVSNAYSAIFLNLYLKYWDEATYTWNYIIPLDSLLRVGRGYETWSTVGNPTITYSGGNLTSNSVSPTLYATDVNGGGIGNSEGWNLVGNPYASAIDLGGPSSPLSGFTWSNLDNTIYMWDGVQYANYNPFTGISINTGTRYVPALQSFFVKANGLYPTLTFPPSSRVHHTQSTYKSKSELPLVRLQVSGNSYSSEFIVAELTSSSLNYDGAYDAYHLNGSEETPEIFVYAGNDELSVQVIPDIHPATIIPVGFEASVNGLYTIDLIDFVNLDDIEYFVLEDLKTGEFVDLLQQIQYNFTASTQDDAYRFNLYFDNVSVSIEESETKPFSAWLENKTLHLLFNQPSTGTIKIMDITGRLITSTDVNSTSHVTMPVSVHSGIYIIAWQSASAEYHTKVLLK
ncbi:MAG: hypothetical protein KQI35_04945 [Bacteroidetes bacterium]|nr:hypothetical protein [Bacteroidota bacterium]